MGNSNIIPYEQYVKHYKGLVIPSGESSVPNDAHVMHENSAYVPDDSLATKLNIYKEQVSIYEQRAYVPIFVDRIVEITWLMRMFSLLLPQDLMIRFCYLMLGCRLERIIMSWIYKRSKGTQSSDLLGFNSLVHSFRALSTLRCFGLRTASAAAKPCQGDSLEFYLITGRIPTVAAAGKRHVNSQPHAHITYS
ncbi:hypothetical protein Tco_0581357 [Tanacetum coccineum]